MQNVYVIQLKDKSIQEKESSGGAYFLFAKWFIENGGFCYGVEMNIQTKSCYYSEASDFKTLAGHFGSKYCKLDYSSMNFIFQKIKNRLDIGKLCLFSGTPCICYALKAFLKKDYSNLYICSLICSGVSYDLEKIEDDIKQKFLIDGNISKIQFRYNHVFFKLEFDSKQSFKCYYWDKYMKQFRNNIEKCNNCKYSSKKDYYNDFDFYIGDTRNTQNIPKEMLNIGKLSRIIINGKGNDIFEKVKENSIYTIIENPNAFFFAK